MNIGNVQIKGKAVLAPMAGISDRAFRELCTAFGASYAVSEMVSAKGISYKSKKSAELMVLSQEERPCGVQIFGDSPTVMAEAAEFAMQFYPDIIDINMGCPAPKICNNGNGAALMKNPKLCGEIVKEVTRAVNVPVTVKIRKGWDENSVNAVEVAKICEQNGASALTVHGRTRKQYYAPPVDYDLIKSVKKSLSIPVIANGDVKSPEDAKRILEYTECDLVMIGRASLGNPWIFQRINAFLNEGVLLPLPSLDERLKVMTEHIEKICEYKGEHMGILQSRKHIAYYLKGMKNAASFRKKSGEVKTLEDVYNLSKEVKEHQKDLVN
ncbi:MAG: tRNA dihydrouridine synthase DusB [Ruminococcus sp.]|nr:tRNA dihydrouridine synthase DusB [Ruminococcus sp.]